MFMRNGRACVLDLSSGSSSELELPEETMATGSALGTAEALRDEHGGSIVLGTGLLTGSLVPAACAGFMSSPKGVMPLLGMAGVELKLAGFDIVVIKGEAERPGYVWVRDGIAEFVPSERMAAMDAWARVERIRADQGDRRIQVVAAGPWGDSIRKSAALTVSHWLGEDDVFMGAEFGRMKLSAIAFRGMGELEVSDPESHLNASVALRSEHASRLGPSSGISSYWDSAPEEEVSRLLHRVVSCHGCPHPCRSFLKVNEDPRQMALVEKEPGYLHFDIPSLDTALSSGMGLKDATAAFMDCARAGVDPSSVLLSGAKDLEGVRAALSSADVPASARREAKGSIRSCRDFDACIGLGLCPRYWAKAGFDRASLDECIESAVGRSIG